MAERAPDELSTLIVAAVDAARHDRAPAAIAAALNAVEPGDLAVFLHRAIQVPTGVTPVGWGLPASPGAASGRIVLDAVSAMTAGDEGQAVILLRTETTPDDVHGMVASRGVVTARGGLASHAAVVARGWGLPAVVGVAELRIDGATVRIGETTFAAGDEITIDGTTGAIYAGALSTTGTEAPPELDTLLDWADQVAAGHVEVRANADTADDATNGRRLGARGIGLCRTEHMFLSADRLPLMRRFILSNDAETEAAALAALEAAQVSDFESVLDAMDGLPVTIRLLDPPLHEFLPDFATLIAREARGELSDYEAVELAAVRRLHESNPMLGTRGVRLGLIRRGVYEMQVRAVCTAAANLYAAGKRPHVELMIPLVVDAEELRQVRSLVTDALDEIGHPELAATVLTIGAMVETPRAALTARALAEHADFFSFGTNDLTQMTYAFSRDDVEAALLPAYLAAGILTTNPFAVLDREGVGELVRMACIAARQARPGIKLGVCGEHGGDPSSVRFLVELGVDSVSCSPFRVPAARLAVAQALLSCGRVDITEVAFAATDTTSATGGDDTAAHDAIDEAAVLHTLRLRGFVTPAGFVASVGAHPTEVLASLIEQGLVRHMEARDLYGLLPPGKERHASMLDEWAPIDDMAALHELYQTFLRLNTDLKDLCTAWQVRDGEPNDHSDAGYDAGCVERLNRLTDDVVPVLTAMARVVSRFGRYLARLESAAARVSAGEHKQFTGVMCESYHDVWMELHEDLIVLQRIDRTAEGSF